MGRTYRSEKSHKGKSVKPAKRPALRKAAKPHYTKDERLPYFNEETDGESFERFTTKRPR